MARRFADAVTFAIDRIREAPHACALAPFVPQQLKVRKRNVEGFPFSVAFLELESEVRILAVAHGRRRPGYWKTRLGEK